MISMKKKDHLQPIQKPVTTNQFAMPFQNGGWLEDADDVPQLFSRAFLCLLELISEDSERELLV